MGTDVEIVTEMNTAEKVNNRKASLYNNHGRNRRTDNRKGE